MFSWFTEDKNCRLSKYLTAIILVFTVIVPPRASADAVLKLTFDRKTTPAHDACVETLEALPSEVIRYAYSPAISSVGPRPYSAGWFEYKNTKREVPRSFHLLTPEDSNVSTELTDWILEHEITTAPSRPTVYEQRVLEFKAGDFIHVVTADSIAKVYQLGQFLGSGNATHIFAIEGEPDKVIRIPFLAHGLYVRNRVSAETEPQRVALNRRVMGEFIDNILELKGATPIVEVGKGFSYVIAQRVNGDEDGLSFVKSLMDDPGQPLHINTGVVWPGDFTLEGRNDPRLVLLMNLMKENNAVVPRPGFPNTLKISLVDVRQYVWDKSLGQWFVVDSDHRPRP